MRILIIGGGYAGLLAAFRLSRIANQADITLVNDQDTFTERIRLHQVSSGQRLKQVVIPKFIGKRPINFLQGFVSAIQPDQQTITVQTEDGEQSLGYDYLLVTLGSRTDTIQVPGVQEHALTLEQTEQLAQA